MALIGTKMKWAIHIYEIYFIMRALINSILDAKVHIRRKVYGCRKYLRSVNVGLNDLTAFQ